MEIINLSHFSFFFFSPEIHTLKLKKAEGYTSAPNSKLLQTEKFGSLTYLWCLEGFPNADRACDENRSGTSADRLLIFKLHMPGWCICNIQKWIFSLLPKQELSDYVVYKCTQWLRSATFTE